MKIFLLLFSLFAISANALDIQSWKTPEGAKVLFVETKGLPMLDIRLNFDAASSRDGDKPGVALMTNNLIGTATKNKDEEQIIQDFESIGANLSVNSLKDMSMVSLRTLTRPEILRKAIHYFKEVVTEPVFKHKYLARDKRQTYQAFEADKQSPGAIANKEFDRLIFADHPYAHPKAGTEESLKEITIDDIQNHYKQYYVAKNMNIAIVGDIDKAKAMTIARMLSQGFREGEKPPTNPMISPLKKPIEKHIEFPSTQTHLLIGHSGINRKHPDYYSLYIGNHILGGSGLTSILSEEIREKRGLTYSVYSFFSKMKSNGYFQIKVQTKNKDVNVSRQVALETLRKFLAEPVDQERFNDAKDNILLIKRGLMMLRIISLGALPSRHQVTQIY
ncbi:MAG: insulinase family protein [Gammaproteobacteria bacterium]|nr:insulinase family protein [Gammaproteobacteria bacterium]